MHIRDYGASTLWKAEGLNDSCWVPTTGTITSVQQLGCLLPRWDRRRSDLRASAGKALTEHKLTRVQPLAHLVPQAPPGATPSSPGVTRSQKYIK